MVDIIIFGIGKITDVIVESLRSQSDFTIKGFCCDREFVKKAEHFGLPVVAFDEVETVFPPSSYRMLVAIGYHDLNRVREARCQAAVVKGYELVSWVSPTASVDPSSQIGANCIVMPGAAIQPYACLKDGVFVWHNAVVGHHATIEGYNWLASNCTISSDTVVGARCFIGVNVAIGHNLTIGQDSFLGAGVVLTRSAPPEGVYITPDTPRYRLNSRNFLRIAQMT